MWTALFTIIPGVILLAFGFFIEIVDKKELARIQRGEVQKNKFKYFIIL